MHQKPFLASLLLAAFPLLATAEPLISFGRQVPLYITGNATLRHDDNIFLRATNEEDDLIFIFAPGADLQFVGSDTKAGVTYTHQWISYMTNTDLDSDLDSFTGMFSHQRPRSRWSLDGAVVELDQNNFNARNFEESARRTVSEVSAAASWDVTAKTSVGTGTSFERTEYESTRFVGNTVWEVPVDWYYAVSPKMDLSAGYRIRQTKLKATDNDSKDHFLNVGARGRFSSKLEGQVRVGVTQRRPETGESSSLLGLSSTLTYAVTPKTTFELNAANDFSSAASGVSQKVLRLGVTGRFELSMRWSVNSSVNFDSSEYLDRNARKDDFIVASVGIAHALTANSSFEVSYLHRKNRSNFEVVNFDNQVVSASASMRF